MNAQTIFDFNNKSDINQWQVVNDGVMGGKSKSVFYLNSDAKGTFQGKISLENNGGFCSVRHLVQPITLENNKNFIIRLKGDKKQYQFKVKTNKYDNHSYIFTFETSGNWETIEIPLREMYPSFRGQKLSIPNYDGSNLAEIAFLIGNKEKEDFELLIESIIVN